MATQLDPTAGHASVTLQLEKYGCIALGGDLWASLPPKMSLRVTTKEQVGKHTLYNLECFLMGTVKDATPLAWNATRRLSQLRKEFHDMVKKELGQSYAELFRGVPFAQRIGPTGTIERLDVWCKRLAACISSGSVSPLTTVITLKALGAPEGRLGSACSNASASTSAGFPLCATLPRLDQASGNSAHSSDSTGLDCPAPGDLCTGNSLFPIVLPEHSQALCQQTTGKDVPISHVLDGRLDGPIRHFSEPGGLVFVGRAMDAADDAVLEFTPGNQSISNADLEVTASIADDNTFTVPGLDSDSDCPDTESSVSSTATPRQQNDMSSACIAGASEEIGTECLPRTPDVFGVDVNEHPQPVALEGAVREADCIVAGDARVALVSESKFAAEVGDQSSEPRPNRVARMVSQYTNADAERSRKQSNLEELAAEWKAKGIPPQSSRWFIRGGHVLDMRGEFDGIDE